MLIIGHRGASGHAPENTLKAFRLAFEQGAHGIECDVFQYKSNTCIIHDHFLDRTTNGTGPVESLGFEALRQLDAGDGEHIPTVYETLGCLPPGGICNLEIKYLDDPNCLYDHIKNAVDTCQLNPEQIIVSSFNHQWLKQLSSLWPTLTTAHLIAHYPEDAHAYFSMLSSSLICIDLCVLDKTIVQACHSVGKKLWVYTVNHARDMKRCKQLGVDAIFTNYPQKACQLALGL